MIYRKLTSSGDYVFGKGPGNFLTDTPETVGQAIQTSLNLIQGEWFLDTTIGVPYNSKILGAGTKQSYDLAIQTAILEVVGVTGIVNYLSDVDPSTRKATISCTVDTVFGTMDIVAPRKIFG